VKVLEMMNKLREEEEHFCPGEKGFWIQVNTYPSGVVRMIHIHDTFPVLNMR